MLRSHAALWPIGRPQTLYWHGRHATAGGHYRLAEWLLQSSRHAAARCRMPFDQALALQALAAVADARGEIKAAAAARHQARWRFERLAAHWHVAQLAENLRT